MCVMKIINKCDGEALIYSVTEEERKTIEKFLALLTWNSDYAETIKEILDDHHDICIEFDKELNIRQF